MKYPYIFVIRHLSPAGALHLCRFLDEKKPRLVLVEGPADFDDMMADMVRSEAKPPIAVLAYTVDTPVRTILYPLAEYSPEYQAVKWCHSHGASCRFIDRNALACQGGFVNRAVSLQNGSVHRDIFAGTHHKHIALCHLFNRHGDLPAIPQERGGFGGKLHQAFESIGSLSL